MKITIEHKDPDLFKDILYSDSFVISPHCAQLEKIRTVEKRDIDTGQIVEFLLKNCSWAAISAISKWLYNWLSNKNVYLKINDSQVQISEEAIRNAVEKAYPDKDDTVDS